MLGEVGFPSMGGDAKGPSAGRGPDIILVFYSDLRVFETYLASEWFPAD